MTVRVLKSSQLLFTKAGQLTTLVEYTHWNEGEQHQVPSCHSGTGRNLGAFSLRTKWESPPFDWACPRLAGVWIN